MSSYKEKLSELLHSEMHVKDCHGPMLFMNIILSTQSSTNISSTIDGKKGSKRRKKSRGGIKLKDKFRNKSQKAKKVKILAT